MSGKVKRRVTAKSIAAVLREAIERGDYKPGDQLPGENLLIAEYGAARLTVRHALSMLQAEGLTVARRGVGVFVRTFSPVVRNGITRVNARPWGAGRSLWETEADGRTLTVESIEVRTDQQPPAEIATLLALPATATVATRERKYVLDGRPVMLATSYFPTDLVADTAVLAADTGPGGVYARLTEIGHEPRHFREDVIARMPTKAETELLQMDAATPVFVITRTAATKDAPVEINVMVCDASAYALRYDFDS